MEAMQKRISDLLHKNGMKGVELAEAASVNASTISRILKGRQIPSAETLYRLARFFGVTMEYLLTGETNTADCADAKGNSEEKKLIEYYHSMSETDREDLLLIAEMKAGKKRTTDKQSGAIPYLQK